MKKHILLALFSVAAFTTACDDVLERPQLEKPIDGNFWRNEMDVRLHANSYYPNFFVGYNSGWSTAWAIGTNGSFGFNDDVAQAGKQTLFENTVPENRGSISTSPAILTQYAGANWNFAWVRNLNVFQNRLQTKAKANLSPEAFDHWWGVTQFLKGYEYCRLVHTFGDVPWFEAELKDTDREQMFKNRDSREFVMDKVYDLFDEALQKIRLNDGPNVLNRYIAAGFISRCMLFEGTWQKYHNNNQELAKKYLKQAVAAADIVRNSHQFEVSGDFRSLFCSQDLKGHKEILMYRHYMADKSVTHMQASYANGYENQGNAANLALAKSFICQNGKVFDGSDEQLTLDEMVRTRDSRFEATFADKPKIEAATLLYIWKFCPREAWAMEHPEQTAIYGSNTNTNDAPVMRYSEVLLNWIEAKAELATLGEVAVTQPEIDESINALRDRPLATEAVQKGVKKTEHLKLSDVTADFDPARDKGNVVAGDYEVAPLIWEIRRERRMEMVYEEHRLLDLKRWKKLHYMDNEKYPDTMRGLWIDMQEDYPALLEADKDGKYAKRQVINAAGQLITYDGSNAAAMVGFYVPLNAAPRDPFTDRSYCSPVGNQQINDYKDRGFTLSQTKGW